MGIAPTFDSFFLPLSSDIDKTQFRAWALAIEGVVNAGVGSYAPNAIGLFSGRATYNAQVPPFSYLSTNGDGAGITSAVAFFKNSATSGDWSAAVPFQGVKGDTGSNFVPNVIGPFSGRATYNAQVPPFSYLSTNGDGALITSPVIFFKNSATSGDWSSAVLFGPTNVREVLTANRTYFVNDATGVDTNDGLTLGTPFKTIQKAENVARTIDFNGFTVTVSIGDGTYTAGATVGQKVGQAAATSMRFTSTSADATKVTISTTSASCFTGNAPFVVDRIKMQTTTSGSAILMQVAGLVQFGVVIFGPCATYCLSTSAPGAKIQCTGAFTIAGNCGAFGVAADGSQIQCESTTITLTGTPAFTQFVLATRLGGILMRAVTFSGSATGQRYSATVNGTIETGGGGASYFPGSTAGGVATGGQYN